ncbi:MAG: hypothetical protein REI78_13980 [Pedobacter sp.]|nr:hypothetical protein [Pedobacter sp.]MDQ8054139.1 hypothetical protein [Pedobacter sp.]
MKNLKNLILIGLLVVVGAFSSCKKDPVMYDKGFTSFKFVVKNTLGVDVEYPGTIVGDEIVVQLPIDVDITSLKASFTIDNSRTIVQVGPTVQESGISAQDFSSPVAYRIKAEDKSTRTYTVRVEQKIALKSFGFFKADNPNLTTDYVGTIKGLNVFINMTDDVDLSNLIARFETTTGATLKVGATVQTSKVTPNSFVAPLTYSFNDPALTSPVNFVVNMVFERSWSLIGTNLTGKVSARDIKVAINPLTNNPSFIYYRTGTDEAGVSIPTDQRKVAVMGYNGTTWAFLGNQTGIYPYRADGGSLAYDKDGSLHAAFKDYGPTTTSDLRATFVKYNGLDWTILNTRFTPLKADYISLIFDKNNNPLMGMMRTSAADNVNNPPVAARGLYVTSNTGGTWTNITPPGGIIVASQHTVFGLDGKVYTAAMDRTSGSNKLSVFQYDNNTWKTIGPASFLGPDNVAGYISVRVAADKDGEVYLAYQAAPTSGRIDRVMKYNKTANIWQELGNPVATGGEADKFALGVDQNGVLYMAWANASSVNMRTFNKVTNNWNPEKKIISEKVVEFDMQVAADGTAYLVASLTSNNSTVAYKYSK